MLCQNSTYFKLAKVKGYVMVDIGGYVTSRVYTERKIERARNEFNPENMFFFCNGYITMECRRNYSDCSTNGSEHGHWHLTQKTFWNHWGKSHGRLDSFRDGWSQFKLHPMPNAQQFSLLIMPNHEETPVRTIVKCAGCLLWIYWYHYVTGYMVETQELLDYQINGCDLFCLRFSPTLVTRKSMYRFIYANLSHSYRCREKRYGGGFGCLDSTRSSPTWSPGWPNRTPTFWYTWKTMNGRRLFDDLAWQLGDDMARHGSTTGADMEINTFTCKFFVFL